MLACLELEYQTGDGISLAQLLKKVELVAADDTKTRQYFEALSGDSEETRKLLESSELVGYQKLYVMEYLLGNKLLHEGAIDEADLYLGKALNRNPWLASAYVDLGRIYMARFDNPTAWELFRAAQNISPTHQELRPITALEKKLAQDFFDFFY